MRRIRVGISVKCNDIYLRMALMSVHQDLSNKRERILTMVPALTVKMIKCLFSPVKQIGRSWKFACTPAAAAFVAGINAR